MSIINVSVFFLGEGTSVEQPSPLRVPLLPGPFLMLNRL
uniref:Uncharacterized protein n=1 Tax=Utricularia reniformis TaxID=192314 RepID=A0A1Y0B1P4_9LAMI|nr:hypothetical protein AEK19_MT1162 [Utricularia reniformis]ART31376.1 hypothetical protein AEK19_MT1162 [Utricularia reniformis]